MPSLRENDSAKTYWRSLDELADTPEFQQFVEDEFPGMAGHLGDPVSRRGFLKLMGASLALAGLAGCRWPREQIVPFTHRPEGWIPGATQQFATAMELGGVAAGLLVTSFDGRPIKIEGNPRHPINRGACDSLAQASLLGLYDPDRSRNIIRREGGQEMRQTWDEFAAFAHEFMIQKRGQGGEGVYVLAEKTSSSSLYRMRARLQDALPRLRWRTYEPVGRQNENRGARLAFDQALRPQYVLDHADLVVCFDADLLMTHPAALKHARDFAASRTGEDGTMNRLYAIESVLSVTGAAADRRWAVQSRKIGAILAAVAGELFGRGGLAFPQDAAGLKSAIARLAERADPRVPAADLADELLAHRGRSVIAVGRRQPPEVHAIVHLLNIALGNHGKTVHFIPDDTPNGELTRDPLRALQQEHTADKNSIDALIILGGNPAYTADGDVDFAALLSEIRTTVHLSLYDDETSHLCNWHLPQAHYLESWGDGRAWDGTMSIGQPLIEPLHDGKSALELLSMFLDEPPGKGYDIVRQTMRGVLGENNFETSWARSLHDGIVPDTTLLPVEPALDVAGLQASLEAASQVPAADASTLEIVFTRDLSVYDGRFANNGWLQELPDPLTKLTWDNAALLSPRTAEQHDVRHGDIITLTVGGRSLDAPVYLLPGQADGSIALALGYGRERSGTVGNGVGVNACRLQSSENRDFDVVTITKTGRKHPLACTQDHHAIDTVGRAGTATRIHALIREADLQTYRENPDFIRETEHGPPLISLWDEHEYDGHRWGMAIDLSLCSGCNACVVACQAENNIPVVGKDEVARGREMHWIRVDRYFSGEPEAPEVLFQPVTCHHCENAPCEQVCPVGATVHDAEGLNVMVYNRCVGTRYCSNNCPYKVRRFNYFNNHRQTPETMKMIFNPDVTMRGRGVMEKCTYCIQRISKIKIAAKNDHRPIADGEIVPACAQTCPTRAIVFGDLADEDSELQKLHEHRRSYAVLGELNVKPRTRYLAKLRNPNREMFPVPGTTDHNEHDPS